MDNCVDCRVQRSPTSFIPSTNIAFAITSCTTTDPAPNYVDILQKQSKTQTVDSGTLCADCFKTATPSPVSSSVSIDSANHDRVSKRTQLRGQHAFLKNKKIHTPPRQFKSLCIPDKSMHPASNVVKRPVRLLIASLGNPSPYQNTRHSAGHLLLQSLQSYLTLPRLSKSKSYGGLVSIGNEVGKPQWTLFQSPTYMNTSGIPILKAYRQFVKEQETSSTVDNTVAGLVILHDELELAPSLIKVRRGPTSAKGHNGIKSVQQSLQSAGLLDALSQGTTTTSSARQPSGRFIKLAIGIGRPEGKTRDPNDISAYVLGQLTAKEAAGIEALADKVVSLLEDEMERLSLSQ